MNSTEERITRYYKTLGEHKSVIFAGSNSLMSECIAMFNQTYPTYLENIQKAINDKDFVGIKGSVHKYKGSLKLFADGPIVETCQSIEESSLARDMDKTLSLFYKLQSENQLLCEALERFTQNLF